VLQYSLEVLNAESGSILFLDEKGQVTNALLAYEGIFRPNDSENVNRIISDGLAGWVVRNRRPALVYNTHEDPRWIKREWELAENLHGRSAVSTPIVLEGKLSGVLTLVRNAPGHFTENDLNLVHQFSFGS
jgi:GAF domain-containing protein